MLKTDLEHGSTPSVIVSHEHRFIFLKTRKTAGTSLEIALSRVCGPDDIVTPLADPDEVLRAEAGGRPPQNFESPPLRSRAHAHVSAARARAQVGRPTWKSYVKFAVERNPWDTAVSLYYWRYKDPERRPPFEEFVNSQKIEDIAYRNTNIYTLKGEVIVDHLLRYENLAEEVDEMWKTLNLPGESTMLHAKSGTRPSSARYRDLYTPETQERVREVFADLIALQKYEF